MDVTPLIPVGRQIVESYGDFRFRVTGTAHEGSVLVFPTRTLGWNVRDMSMLTLDGLAPVIEGAQAGDIELLLLGCGPRLSMVPRDLRAALRAQNVVIEPMDTGAAARTFNVLMAEGRRVAAALIAVE
ncbi:Mth938-like domain-containing protein [Dongia sp.]|uniref:Mth938-like domain-containing protein n=1 Tax=Dongia sp. TaxID=1977262 RepID=UPI0035B30F49